ncbi:MAG: putative DNA binding domain-containing protein [Roseburia sp.]|nr:putative DNA binding domain-containing protein [Roseburia sp.]MCM1097043.1 putative DNA binding domain-containing protein [Ruminococcus flavefaciens]
MSENQNIEYKESWRTEYLKWVCGFANAQGGTIYIGIDDAGKVVGLKDTRKLMDDIPNQIQSGLGIIADVNKRTKDGLDYIEIKVNPSTYPVNYHGEYHYRSGSTKQQLQGAALTEFIRQKTGYLWDAVPVDNIGVDDLDRNSLDIFRREAVRKKRMEKEDLDISDVELLDHLDLLVDGKLKRAAVMLFYQKPGRIITGCYVKIGKFGEGSDLQYQDTVEGSLFSIADRVIDLIYTKYLKAAISYEHDVRVETYPFPREGVREAIYNALGHNNYAASIPIQIRIEEDAMYISNNCILPKNWTAETLMKPHKSEPFNPSIANVFFRAGYIEAWGRGIQKICEACRELGTAEPEYTVLGDDLTVKFTALESAKVSNPKISKYQIDTLDDTLEGKILALLKRQPSMTQSEIALLLDISVPSVKRAMKKLLENGDIVRKGGKRFGYWEVS